MTSDSPKSRPAQFSFRFIDGQVRFKAEEELVEVLNSVDSLPYIEEGRRAGQFYFDHDALNRWVFGQQVDSPQKAYPKHIQDVLFGTASEPLSAAKLKKLGAEASTFLSQVIQATLALHQIARRKVFEGELYTGEDILAGLCRGDQVLLRGPGGDHPTIVTDVRHVETNSGACAEVTGACLMLNDRGMVTWQRVSSSVFMSEPTSKKSGAVSPLTEAQKDQFKPRGTRYLKLATQCRFAAYNGPMLVTIKDKVIEVPCRGRVILDPLGASQLTSSPRARSTAFGPDYDPVRDFQKLEPYLCFTPQFVPGFSFKLSRWGLLSLELDSDIQFRTNAFKQLVLDADTKDTILSLVKYNGTGFTDVIEGKSGGTSFLLYGPPGCGKTLTAETVAEELQRPLYVLKTGELGTDVEKLEAALKQALATAERWNAVVLLDEADLYVERRTSSELIRNSLVSVFLREMEYFSGIMFMTTNRAKNLDPAILHRVALGIRYKKLSVAARGAVWDMLITEATGAAPAFSIAPFARRNLQGRQIKNTLRSALTLGVERNEGLTRANLLRACNGAERFVNDCEVPDFE